MAISVVTLVVLTSACLFAAVGVGFVFVEKYVKHKVSVSHNIGSLELVGVPAWLNEPLKQKVFDAALGDGHDLRLDEDTARAVQDNLTRKVAWLDDVRVQLTHDRIRVKARWRKPLALIKSGRSKFYVDAEQVVLDFVPVAELAIVEVKGLSARPEVSKPGEIWRRDDLGAALVILDSLNRMDKLVSSDKPLVDEIKSIDVANYDGRKNSRAPHVVFYTKDNTKVIWGAEYGKWQRYLESTDEQKIAKLYQHYRESGTLNGVKFINLCDPQDNIPLPIDKY